MRVRVRVRVRVRACVSGVFVFVCVGVGPHRPAPPHLQDILTEFIFVIDRSTSMIFSENMESAKGALGLLLQSLPESAYFNIVSFGSRHELLFPKSERYTESTLARARAAVQSMRANLGGTEILGPLQAIQTMPVPRGYARSIFVLTDGAVANTEQTLHFVRAHAARARVFSLGVGASVSHHLVEGLARAGRGTAQFVEEGERMQGKVVRSQCPYFWEDMCCALLKRWPKEAGGVAVCSGRGL